MRDFVTTLILAIALALANPCAAADGLVDFSWNACAPVVQDVSSNAPGPFSLYISVLGFDQPHQAYETTFIYGDADGLVPDAWRFDPAGCQGSSFITINHLAPAVVAKACPTFQGNLASVQVKDVAFVPPGDQGTGYLATNLRVSLFDAYPPGILSTNAGTRYFLERVVFDHTYSVYGAGTPGETCGEWQIPMTFKIIRANYLTLPPEGLEIPFGRNIAPGQPLYVTFNTQTPARPTTWGAIKHQYR